MVEPEEADRLVAILRRIKREGLPKAFSVKGKGLPELSSGKGELFLVGLPMYDTKELLRLAYRVKLSGGRVVLLSPNKPWRDVNDLERAYLIYVSFKKSLASFRRLGAEVKLWGRLGSIS